MIGNFLGKITDYGISETKSNKPQVFVKFTFPFEQGTSSLTWFSGFVGGQKDITLKALLDMGFAPGSQLMALAQGPMSGLLNMDKDLSLDVQEEMKQDGSGMRTLIQWVNDPARSGGGVKTVDENKAGQMLGGMDFEGDLVRLAGEMGINPAQNGGQNLGQNQNQNVNQNQNQNMNGQNNQNMNQNMNGQNMGQNNAQGANNGSNQATPSNQNNQNNGYAQNASNFNNGQNNQNMNGQNNGQQNFQNNGQNNGQNMNQNQNNGQNGTGNKAPF